MYRKKYFDEKKVIRPIYLYVKKEMRKKRIATKLLYKVEEYAKENQINIIELKCFNNNEVATNLYKKYNYISFCTDYRKEI